MTLAHIRSKKKDEYYTPRILVDVILPYIPQKSIVWCPFDTKNSEFVLALQERGTPVIFGHIATGQDFFDPLEEPEEYDVIVHLVSLYLQATCYNDLDKAARSLQNQSIIAQSR